MIASLSSSWIRRFSAGTAAIAIQAVLGHASLAQETAPGFLKDLPVEPVGVIAGLPAWKLGDDDAIWMAMPDGKVIVGYVFDAKGQDISSALVGKTPVSAWESLEIPDPNQVSENGGLSEVAPWDEVMSEETAAEPANLPALDIETADLTPAGSSPEDPLARPVDEVTDALLKDALSVTETTLANLPEEQKRALVAKLVLALEAAKTPEEFQLAIIRWNEEATGKKLLPDDFALPASPETPTAASESAAAPAAASEAAAPATEPPAEAVQAAVDPAQATNASLLADIRTNGFWFGVGSPDAPTVYMIADPACPYCARSIKNLREEVESGKIQLRVLLAPFVSKTSPDLIAGILLSEDPAKAYFEHSLQYADRGASDLVQKPFKDLPAEIVNAVRGNYDMVGSYGLRGVPFFGWETAEGTKLFNGVPNPGHFSAAIKDDYAGNRTTP